MRRTALAPFALAGLLAAPLAAQEKTAAEKKAVAVPGDVEVQFLNGSTVRMIVGAGKLEVDTPYGKLAVPVKDVRAIEFGLHFPDGVEAKIAAAAQRLGSPEYRTREAAAKELIGLGPYSYPAVLEAARDKDLDVARRAKDLAKQLQAAHPKKDLKTAAEDKVVTPSFAIVGRVATRTLKARADYFGEVELSVATMRTMRAVGAAPNEVAVKVDAGKYANAGQWMETPFEVDGRTPLVITTKGQVDTWPQQPGQWMAGPNGVQNGGMGIRVVGGGGGGAIVAQANGGALFGKIGEDGEPFMIGERYQGTPEREGKLYLHIGPSPWNCPSAGHYEVTISPQR